MIYSINGKEIKDRTSLQNVVASFKPNDKVIIKVERNKKDIELNIILGIRDSLAQIQSNTGRVLSGLKLSNIDAATQKKFRITSDIKGILITDVEPKSKAEKAGFQAGDVIIQIEDIEVKNFVNVEKALNKFSNVHKRVYINRYGQTILFVIK